MEKLNELEDKIMLAKKTVERIKNEEKQREREEKNNI